MGAEKIAFYLLSGITLVGGVAILFSNRLMRAVVYLLVSLFGVAGLYLILHAEFLAALQVLIYIGGITVLLVFGLMLTGPGQFQNRTERPLKAVTAAISTLTASAVLFVIIRRTAWPAGDAVIPVEGATAEIGRRLLTDNVFAFEIASVLLLVVLVGVALFIRLARAR